MDEGKIEEIPSNQKAFQTLRTRDTMNNQFFKVKHMVQMAAVVSAKRSLVYSTTAIIHPLKVPLAEFDLKCHHNPHSGSKHHTNLIYDRRLSTQTPFVLFPENRRTEKSPVCSSYWKISVKTTHNFINLTILSRNSIHLSGLTKQMRNRFLLRWV